MSASYTYPSLKSKKTNLKIETYFRFTNIVTFGLLISVVDMEISFLVCSDC